MHKVTRDTFEEEVLGSDVPVVLDFWGPRCVPCIRLEPSVMELNDSMQGAVKFYKVIAPENRMLCVDLRVMGLPTFLAFRDGQEVGRLTGDDISMKDIETLAGSLV
ncbi:MAG: thioredoxin [Actinobacteria bacterium]|nr:thioredoxin [Actinomycetota bacterium]